MLNIVYPFTELVWVSEFTLYELQYKTYVSLPGANMYLNKVELNKAIPGTVPLTIVWINDNYNRYQHFTGSTFQKCSLTNKILNQMYCEKYFFPTKDAVEREYFLIRNYHHNFYHPKKFNFNAWSKKINWEDASYLCGLLGGYLPWFESKDSLNELLSLIKLSNVIPTVEAIYIGLKFQENEVSEVFFL